MGQSWVSKQWNRLIFQLSIYIELKAFFITYTISYTVTLSWSYHRMCPCTAVERRWVGEGLGALPCSPWQPLSGCRSDSCPPASQTHPRGSPGIQDAVNTCTAMCTFLLFLKVYAHTSCL